jgi:hypothetical protein
MVYFGLFFAGISMSAYAALHVPKKTHQDDEFIEVIDGEDDC